LFLDLRREDLGMVLPTGLVISAVWLWLGVAVIMAVVEAFTMGLTSIWFAGGAVVAAVVSFVTDSFIIQLLVFVVASLVLLYFTRPIAAKKLNKETVKTNTDALTGMTGIAESDIKNHEKGTVKADNKMWTAILAEGAADVLKGEIVKIESIEGVKLVVRKENE
jgi:membrane protein implicated in regulation of membrane protease activity